VRVEHFSYLTRIRTQWCLPVPVPYPCRKLLPDPTRPDPTRGYIRTRSLPVGLALLGIIGLLAYPRPGPLHCISSDESISVVENMSCLGL